MDNSPSCGIFAGPWTYMAASISLWISIDKTFLTFGETKQIEEGIQEGPC